MLGKSRKGVVGEDLLAIFCIAILIMFFIFSVFNLYSDYFGELDLIENERIANSVANKLFLESGGVVDDPENFVLFDKANILVINLETGENWGTSSTGNQTSVSSFITLVKLGKIYYPGRVEVYVNK
jgi:hypothetical protein